MSKIEIKGYDRITPVQSFADWEANAMPPMRKGKHWKEGRSAFELGRIWTENGEPAVPADLVRLLDSHSAATGTVIRTGIVEHETRLPPGPGGPRCHDLALQGEHAGRGITICIEAKADESFGGTIAKEVSMAIKMAIKRTGTTKFPDRLEWLVTLLLGIPAFLDPQRAILAAEIVDLQYQLFSAVGGTLLEAELQKSAMAILVVHEFRTTLTTDARMEENGKALDKFLRVLLAKNGGAKSADFHLGLDQLLGPIVLRPHRTSTGLQSMPNNIPLFIGKIRTDRTKS